MGPDSFQWCPVTGQGAMGTNWSIGSPVWTWGRTSSLWGWQSTGTGCSGRLWSLLLWRYSRSAWTWSCAACCRWPCLGRGVGPDDPQRSLPTPTILWFCDSVTPSIATKLAFPKSGTSTTADQGQEWASGLAGRHWEVLSHLSLAANTTRRKALLSLYYHWGCTTVPFQSGEPTQRNHSCVLKTLPSSHWAEHQSAWTSARLV